MKQQDQKFGNKQMVRLMVLFVHLELVELLVVLVSYLKEKNKDVKIYLSDPTGSALYNYIT